MLTNKLIINKFYLYKARLVKVKKIHKTSGTVFLQFLDDETQETIPENSGGILLARLYTIGELAKITGKRSDTLRKYEKRGLMPKPSVSFEFEKSYKNWRFYNESDVYDVIKFFTGRTPGRPVSPTPENVKKQIKLLNTKVNS